MSYLNPGIGKLTEQIYVAQTDAAAARSAVRKAVRASHDGFGSPELVEGAVSAMNHHSSYTAGLVKAWELVTGEIWGEASWQPGATR